MAAMQSQVIRRKFLDYFKRQGHVIVPSSPVIPFDDPTLLFTNAGMNQFKDLFLGKAKRDYTRAATTQKCIRAGGKHNDLENVGHTTRHLTFFEMLGNFSFGNYFKKEAIQFAWDVTTEVYGFDPKRVWVSVYQDDDEAFSLWRKHIPADRIVRFGEKENFWSMGDTGPCGPCSELHYDRGESYGAGRNPTEDPSGERYLEFWNLVFMQFQRFADGRQEVLPQQSIDTGSGLERVVSLSMGVQNVFQTDVLRGLISRVEELSGKTYNGEAAFQVIADHIRSLSFAIADGATPSNLDRGYVLRKILRRAVRYGRMLGFQKPFLGQILPRLVEFMGDDFPELKKAQSQIGEILTLEEESFLRTLQRGGQLLAQVIDRSRSTKQISGDDAFKLKDTYGLPLEEVELIAIDEGLHVDRTRFAALEEEAKEKSRKAHKTHTQEFDKGIFDSVQKSQFVGYQQLASESRVVALLREGRFVDALHANEEGLVFLDTTPFYAEMGGQVGDTGFLTHGASRFEVQNALSPASGLIAHTGRLISGSLKKGDKVQAVVEGSRRDLIQRNHSATHLLHWALEQILGSHVKQAGSLVDDRRLRFDFHHHKAVSPEELAQIEDLVNAQVRADRAVEVYELPYEEAQKRSDIKQFFGEKYGASVRVIDLDVSKELCGGTHVSRTGTIGYFRIAKEGSVAAGVRRIEAITGSAAEAFAREEKAHLHLKIAALQDEKKRLEADLKQLRKGQLTQLKADLIHKASRAGKIPFIAAEVSVAADELAPLADDLLKGLGTGVVALGAIIGDRCQLLVQCSPQSGADAKHLIQQVAPLIEGGGGGKPQLAQAGGKKPDGLVAALQKIGELLNR